jgi:hypothetical protein
MTGSVLSRSAVLSRGLAPPHWEASLTVSAVVAGGGPIGSLPEMFGYDVPADQAITPIAEILRSPKRPINGGISKSERLD